MNMSKLHRSGRFGLFLFAALLCAGSAACDPEMPGSGGISPPTQKPDMTTQTSTLSPCVMPADTLSRDTPEQGYWLADCKAHCLPPKQIFAICTEKLGKLATPGAGDFEIQDYGASAEVFSQTCPSTPWRVWRLQAINYPDFVATGNYAVPSVSGICEGSAMSVGSELPRDRQYYRVLEEVTRLPGN